MKMTFMALLLLGAELLGATPVRPDDSVAAHSLEWPDAAQCALGGD
jgi:hypothetical protein